jgi:hypothetical protein
MRLILALLISIGGKLLKFLNSDLNIDPTELPHDRGQQDKLRDREDQ